MKTCKFCNERIPADAKVCPVCAEELEECKESEQQSEPEASVEKSRPQFDLKSSINSIKQGIPKPKFTEKSTESTSVPEATTPQSQKSDSKPLQKKSSKSKPWIIIIIVLLILGLLGFALYWINRSDKPMEDDATEIIDKDEMIEKAAAAVESINARGDSVIVQFNDDNLKAIFYLTKSSSSYDKYNMICKHDLAVDSTTMQMEFAEPYIIFEDVAINDTEMIIIGNSCERDRTCSVIKYNLKNGSVSRFELEGDVKFNADKTALEIEEQILYYQGSCTAYNVYSTRRNIYDFNGTLVKKSEIEEPKIGSTISAKIANEPVVFCLFENPGSIVGYFYFKTDTSNAMYFICVDNYYGSMSVDNWHSSPARFEFYQDYMIDSNGLQYCEAFMANGYNYPLYFNSENDEIKFRNLIDWNAHYGLD